MRKDNDHIFGRGPGGSISANIFFFTKGSFCKWEILSVGDFIRAPGFGWRTFWHGGRDDFCFVHTDLLRHETPRGAETLQKVGNFDLKRNH